jgi:hypothetical protein
MAIQTINIGNQVNDGLGDDLRTAFQKVNANFTDLNASLTITASNLGTTGKGIFKEKVDSDLKFKSLVEGNYITIDDSSSSVLVIANSMPDSFYKIDTDSGTLEAKNATARGHITLQGDYADGATTNRTDIEVSVFGSIISVKTRIPVVDILTSYDFGTITGSYNNTIQTLYASSNIDFGTITLPGRLDLDCGSIL